MADEKKYRQLPKGKQGRFLKFVDDRSFGVLVFYGLITYVGVVLFISMIEIVALKCFDVKWVEVKGKGTIDVLNVIYFNFITILTIGYGDISPIGFGKILSTLEALFGVGWFAGAISLLTVKALRPTEKTIVFSRYAYYCLDEQRFMIIFLNTSIARLENCSISSYFKLGRDWAVTPAIAPPFLTTAVQTFFVDQHDEKEIKHNLMEGDCLRVSVSGNLMGSEVAASVQYKPNEILVLQNRDFIAKYEPFWHPNFEDPEFERMFHFKPEGAETLVEKFGMNQPS